MFPNRSTFLWIGLCLGVFVIYGSLVPFAFRPVSADDVATGLSVMLASQTARSLSDFAVNVLLLVPLAFVLCGAFCLDRPGLGVLLWGSLCAIAAGLLVSVAAEVGQIFIQDRTPSISDVLAQTIGNLIGIVLWWTAGPALTSYLRRVQASRGHAHLFTIVLGLYAAIWFLRQWLPLDLTIRPSEIYQKYREGRLTLSLVAPGPIDAAHLNGWMLDALAAVPIGALSVLAWTRRHRVRSVGLASLLAVLTVATAEVLQVFVFSRSSRAFDALIASCGALVGVCGAHALGPGLGFHDRPSVALGVAARARVALLVWMGILVLYHWSPFVFTTDSGVIADRWSALSFVPFVNYEAASAFVALEDLVTKVLLALPLGLVLGILSPGPAPRRASDAVVPLVTAWCFFLLIEGGQLFLRGRVPDVTDVLTQTVAAAIGVWLVFRQPAPGSDAERWSTRGQPPSGRSSRPPRSAGSVTINPEFRSRRQRDE